MLQTSHCKPTATPRPVERIDGPWPAQYRLGGADAYSETRPSLEVTVIWALISILTVLWLIGLAFDFGGVFANVLLVIVAVLVTLELAKRMRATA
jgi:hypothetical protein